MAFETTPEVDYDESPPPTPAVAPKRTLTPAEYRAAVVAAAKEEACAQAKQPEAKRPLSPSLEAKPSSPAKRKRSDPDDLFASSDEEGAASDYSSMSTHSSKHRRRCSPSRECDRSPSVSYERDSTPTTEQPRSPARSTRRGRSTSEQDRSRSVSPVRQRTTAPRTNSRAKPRSPTDDADHSDTRREVDEDRVYEFHPERIRMSPSEAMAPVSFTREQWLAWASSCVQQQRQRHTLKGIPYVLEGHADNRAYDDACWRWVRATKRVNVDHLQAARTYANIAKIRDMRFRFAHLVATDKLKEDLAQGRGESAGHASRDRAHASGVAPSVSGAGIPAAATVAAPGATAPTRGRHLDSPRGADHGPPTYSRSSGSRATSRGVRGDPLSSANPRSPPRGSVEYRGDPRQEAAPAVAAQYDAARHASSFGLDQDDHIRRLQSRCSELERRCLDLETHSAFADARVGRHRDDQLTLEGRLRVVEQEAWHDRHANERSVGDRLHRLETDVQRLLDFQVQAAAAVFRGVLPLAAPAPRFEGDPLAHRLLKTAFGRLTEVRFEQTDVKRRVDAYPAGEVQRVSGTRSLQHLKGTKVPW